MTSRFERFLAHLDRLTGGVQPRFDRIPSHDPLLAQVSVMTYLGYPEPGYLVGHTYGVSLARHPGHPTPPAQATQPADPDRPAAVGRELLVSVRSTDRAWSLAAGRLAEALRGTSAFADGDTFDFREPISAESALSAYVVYTPTIADPADIRVDLSDDDAPGTDVVELAGLYPVHAIELQYIAEHGVDAFWNLDWDSFDVRRPPAV